MDKSTTSLPVHITSGSIKIDEDLKNEFVYLEYLVICTFVNIINLVIIGNR